MCVHKCVLTEYLQTFMKFSYTKLCFVLFCICIAIIWLSSVHIYCCSFFAFWHSFKIQQYWLNNNIFAENTQSLKINLLVIEVQRWWFVPFHKIEEFSVNTGKRDVIELELPNGKFLQSKVNTNLIVFVFRKHTLENWDKNA